VTLRYIGIFTVLLAAFLISREYSHYMKKRLRECEGFIAFIAHMRIQVGCFMRPVKELAAGFSSDALSDVGFIDALSESDGIYEAYKKIEPRLSLSKNERDVLELLFSSVGGCYLEEGMKIIEAAYGKMESLHCSLSEECQKNIKLVSVLSVTAAIGFLILVI